MANRRILVLVGVLAAISTAGLVVMRVMASPTGSQGSATVTGTATVADNATGAGLGAASGASVTGSPSPQASRSATTSPRATCGGAGRFPDADCTGPTGQLKPYTGTMEFRTAGQVVRDVEIRTSGMYVGANNVTFRNVRIVYTGSLNGTFTVVNVPPGVRGVVFEDCEIDGQHRVARAIKAIEGAIVRRCEIHRTGNGVEVATNFTVEDCYLHDIVTPAGQDWHADGIQSAESVSNITVRHNTILLTGGETGAINIIGGAADTISNVLVENNLMAGGGYTVYAGAGKVVNYRVVNNRFSTRYHAKVGVYGVWYPTFLSGVVRSGNVIHETGAPTNG